MEGVPRRSILRMLAMVLALVDWASAMGCHNAPHCECDTGFNNEMTCRDGDSEYRFYITNPHYAYLSCYNVNQPSNYSILPSLPVSTPISVFGMRDCPLPEIPFSDLINHLTAGNQSLEQLYFQHSRRNVSGALKRYHFRNLSNVYRLVLSDGAIKSLPEDLFEDMPNITWLNLRGNEIHLSADVFKPIQNLTFLELGNNELRTLPDGLFKHISGLKQLNVWKNRLRNLTMDKFEGLDSLEMLDLSENAMESIESDAFQYLPNLKTLSLSYNNFSALPGNLLAGRDMLELFKMNRNYRSIHKIPSGFLSNLKSLTSVELDDSRIESLEEGVFWGSTKIQNISLKQNLLVSIPSALFKDQSELWNLDLKHNKITHLPDNAFQFLKNLKTLDLKQNNLATIPGKLFSSCLSLHTLIISNNKLQDIGREAFKHTRNLQSIDMSYNNLRLIDNNNSDMLDGPFGLGPHSPFDSLQNLKYLNLSHNIIDIMFNDWRILNANLMDLDLSYNSFTKIEFRDIFLISNNVKIDLRNNEITEINFWDAESTALSQNNLQPDAYNSHAVKPSNVKVLIENNPFNCDCIMYDFVRYMRGEIDPQVQSLITVIPGNAKCHSPANLEDRLLKSLDKCDMICNVDYSESNVTLCPKNCNCFVRKCDKYQLIECSAQNMKLPMNFPVFKEFKDLELNFENSSLNSIVSLGLNTSTLNSIKKLYVSGNNISKLTVDDIPNNLTAIDLRNNHLTYVDTDVVNKLGNASLQAMYFSGNPIMCDCKNLQFLTFLQDKYSLIKDLKDVKCQNGDSVHTILIGNLCSISKELIAGIVILALFVFIIGIAAALYYKYQQEIKVWLFAKGWLLRWITDIDEDKTYDAFLSWSHKDDDFVINKLLPELESGPNPFKICVHYRDWVVGEMISTQITRTIMDSKRTIVVLSPNFLESVWGILEFKIAHCRALEEGRTRVIVIRYGDIGPTEKLDEELQAYLSTNTYLEWGDPRFWQKLRYALPHPTIKKPLNLPHSIINKKDDKLELIHPSSPTTPPGQNTPPAHQAHTNPLMNHVSSLPNGVKPTTLVNGSITLNGRKINGNAKHSDV